MLVFTVEQVNNGVGVGWNTLKVQDLALKNDVVSKDEFTELQNEVDDKLDKKPPHTHEISDINQLNDILVNHATAINQALENMVSADHTHATSDITNLSSFIVDLIYPIGSIYITTDSSKTPTTLFPGTTWEQITDRFLWCSSTAGETGGSKKITVEQLPAHSHEQYCTANVGIGTGKGIRATWDDDGAGMPRLPMGIQGGETGGGEDYMPPYLSVLAWKRTK